MEIKETYNKGCDHCGAMGYVNYYLADGKTGSQYTNVCPVCNGSGVVIVTRTYEVPDIVVSQIPLQNFKDEEISISKIEELISLLDTIARDYDDHNYGLPTSQTEDMKMKRAIRSWLKSCKDSSI